MNDLSYIQTTAVAYFIYALIFGFVCEVIARPKHRDGFLWGFLLGILGLIVVICLPPLEDKNTSSSAKKSDTNKYENLSRIADLHKKGVLDDAEFKVEKQKILGNSGKSLKKGR